MTDDGPSGAVGAARCSPGRCWRSRPRPLLLVGTAAFGPSAASPGLGAETGWRATLPPWSLGFHASSALVTGLVDAGYLLGADRGGLGAVGRPPRRTAAAGRRRCRRRRRGAHGAGRPAGLRRPPQLRGVRPDRGRWRRPYVVPPQSWHGGHDPVTSAVEPPWTTTPSIYGPVATAVQALCSLVGGDSLRLTVWCWQLVCLAAWLCVGWLVIRLCRNAFADDDWRVQRAGWVWLLNPVLLAVLLIGAHVDLLGAAFAIGALALAGRRPLLAGMLLGAAVGVKITFAALRAGAAVRLVAQGSWRLLAAGADSGCWAPRSCWCRPSCGPGRTSSTSSAGPAGSSRSPPPGGPFVDWATGPVSNDAVRSAVVVLTPVVVLGPGRAALAGRAPGAERATSPADAGDQVTSDAAARRRRPRRGLRARRAVLAALVRRRRLGAARAGGRAGAGRAAAGAACWRYCWPTCRAG